MSETGRDFWEGVISMTPAAQKHHTPAAITLPYESSHFAITFFVYCYNSDSTILDTLHTLVEAMEVVQKTYEIVLIDDGSQDHSSDLVKGFMGEFPRISIVFRANKERKGLAQNYIDAAFIGCGKYFRLIYGDNSESVETMVDVLKAIGDADIVVPYYVTMYRKTWVETYIRGFGTWVINMVSGNHINHYAAAHVHLRYNVMRWQANTQGCAFQTDLLCRLLEQGFTLKQVPCRAVPHRMKEGYCWGRFWSVVHVLIDVVFRRLTPGLKKK